MRTPRTALTTAERAAVAQPPPHVSLFHADAVTEARAEALRCSAVVVGKAVLVKPVVDTLKLVRDGLVEETLDRERLRWPVAWACRRGLEPATDPPAAEWFVGAAVLQPDATGDALPDTRPLAVPRAGLLPVPRVGCGYDAHQLADGRRLVLGGVEIPHDRGLVGHSDADVLIHAIIDALLGAAGLGDIGQHFPTDDPSLRGVSSLLLLRRVGNLLTQHGWRPANVDATVIAERPRLSPHTRDMRLAIAGALDLAPESVSVKATTADRLGFTGREEGIAAMAVTTVVGGEPAAAGRGVTGSN
ncbi:MAG: 2-C-methyl-D-erythritol 2,4-cyclodiphosphate synthase [Chloroflexota bacterium]